MKKRKLFIGNLDYTTTAEQLRIFLAPYGTVIGVRMMEGKGYAFVEMGSEEQAQNIQRTLSESVFNGRKLLIDGVPGTRRPVRKSEHSPRDSRERRPAQESGRKADPACRGDVKKSLKPEWKNREFMEEQHRPARPDRTGTAYPIPSPAPQDQKTPKPTPKTSKEHPKSTPVSKPSVGSVEIKKKITQPEPGPKPASSSIRKSKKSKVPAWVMQKRSAGTKNKQEKF